MALNYERIGWENAPSTNTPIDAGSLNHMDNGILAVSNQYDVDVPYLQQQVAGIPAMLDSYLAEEIGTDVTAWLNAHVTPGGSTIVVDDTLSISGAAADAAKCGELKNALDNQIDAVSNGITYFSNETVTVGNHVFVFDTPIPSGTLVTLKNESLTTSFSVKFRDAFGTSQTMIAELPVNSIAVITAPFDTVDMQCYCTNTEWKFTLKYGDNFNQQIKDVYDEIDLVRIGKTYSHKETITVGYHVYRFDKEIRMGNAVKIKNNSSTTTFSLNVRKVDGTSETISSGIAPNNNITFIAPFNIYDMRCYCNSTDWDFTISCGDAILSKVENILIRNSEDDNWAIGTMGDGVFDGGSNTKRMTDLTYIPVFRGCIIKSELSYTVTYYDSDKKYMSVTNWIAAGSETVIDNDYPFIRIIIKVSDSYDFVEADILKYSNSINIEYPINSAVQSLKEFQSEVYDNVQKHSFNSAYHKGTINWSAKCAAYSQLFNNSEHVENFMFFTDPHFFTRNDSIWQDRMVEYIAEMQKYYNSVPMSFCLCGGDWLTAQDSNDTALFRLGYIDGFMNAMFKDYYPMFGNHDDNYQGATVDGGTAATAVPLDKQTIVNLWFKKYKKAYYSFTGATTKFYVFDTGRDWNTELDSYRWEQIQWFGNSLLEDRSSERIAIALHIAYNTLSDYENGLMFPMTDYIGQMLQAFNNRTDLTLNGETYHFSTISDLYVGKVRFMIAGHLHADGLKTAYGIPVILTTNTQSITNGPSFDLVYVDYDNDVIKTVRVGNGSDRIIQL